MNVDEMNAFFGPLAPGLNGVVFDAAATLCAAGCGDNIPEDHSFTVVVTNETTEMTMALFRCTQMILSPR